MTAAISFFKDILGLRRKLKVIFPKLLQQKKQVNHCVLVWQTLIEIH